MRGARGTCDKARLHQHPAWAEKRRFDLIFLERAAEPSRAPLSRRQSPKGIPTKESRGRAKPPSTA